VLPPAVTRRVAIEAGSTGLWWKYVGTQGRVLGIDTFGASGKASDLYRHFGLTAERLIGTISELLNN
jgi:transketolase